MPKVELPFNPGRMIPFGSVPEPSSDACGIPFGIPKSKGPADNGGVQTPIDVVSRPTVAFNVPGVMADPSFQARRARKPSKF